MIKNNNVAPPDAAINNAGKTVLSNIPISGG
jgi:hypothetical protein